MHMVIKRGLKQPPTSLLGLALSKKLMGSLKVPINPKLLFCLNKYMCNSEQNGAKMFDLGQNRNFL